MRIFTLSALLMVMLSGAVLAQSAPAIPKPQVWLRADGGIVSSPLWSDMSGHKHHATAQEGPEVSTELLNYNPKLLFDGLDDLMEIPYSLEGISELTIMAIFHSADTTERGIIVTQNPLSRKVLLTTSRVTGPDSAASLYGNHGKLPVIGALVQNWTDATQLSPNAFLALGADVPEFNAKPFKGMLAEVLVYNYALTFLERQQVKTYLALKYGISLQAGNYLSAAQEVLWHGEQNSGYAHHITGLGRDDAFSLNQKQAKSTTDTSSLLVLSAGPLAASNAANKATLRNGDFLLWGDNGLSLNGQKGQGQDSLLTILERKWLMQVTGTTASQLPGELRLDLSKLPKDSLGYWLVIDRSGRGNFSPEVLEYVQADSVSPKGIAFYRNLKWDTDRSGKDHFSFASAKKLLAVASNQVDPNCENQSGGSSTMRVVGGKAPFRFELSNPTAKIDRRWEGAASAEQKNLPAGQYTLRVRDADNEQAQWTFSLVLPNTLIVDLGPNLALGEEPLLLDAGTYIPDSIPATYAWESNFGFKSKDRKISPTETGIYTVTVINAEGCTFQDQVEVSGGTEQRYAVFPTLLRHGKTVNVSISLKEAGPVQVKIRTLNGTLYHQMQGQGSSEYHFTGSFREVGMYLVVFESPEGTKTKRIAVY